MATTAPLLEARLPELAYGTVWLIGASNGEPSHLSPAAVHALGSADAVIHLPNVAPEILDLVKPPRYREAASPDRAIERTLKLAQDGWRVVLLIDGDAIPRALEYADQLTESNVPSRVVPHDEEPPIVDASAGLVLIRKPVAVGHGETGFLIVLIPAPRGNTTARRRPPVSFSMIGIAG